MKHIRGCPFCGSIDKVSVSGDEWGNFMRCGECGAHGPFMYTPDEALIEWNKRENPGFIEMPDQKGQ